MEKYQNDFIKKISNAVKKYAPQYDIKVYSPIIAQAIIESGWGKSKLAEYNNFFGMKCGASYKGNKVTMQTREVINGKNVTVSADFRAYKTAAAGIKGYFDFINTARYQNLKGVTNAHQYLENIKNDGYATDPNYISAVMAVIENNNLFQYDPENKNEKQPKHESKTTEKIQDWSVDKCFEMLADDVIKNVRYWGCGEVRKNRLYNEIQLIINKIVYHKLKCASDNKIENCLYIIASDIIKNPNKYGNGEKRKDTIYSMVQKHINNKMR